MADNGTTSARAVKVEGYVKKPTYHKSPRTQQYDCCPACKSRRCVNYIKQAQRGMRWYTCARCSIMFYTWGPKILNPRPLRDGKGRRIVFVDEMGD